MTPIVRDKAVAQALDSAPPDELDNVLRERREEVDALLEEAQFARSEGRFAPLEPLHDFLRRARARFRNAR
jgi:hypothetical protein